MLLFAMVLVSWALTGCASNLLGNESVQRTYLLDAQLAMGPAEISTRKTLLVAEPRAEAGFDTPSIAYSQAPAALTYYTQSSWIDTPARMLLPLLVQVLEDSQAFAAVLTPPALVPVDLRLDVNLIRLQQEFLQQPSRVRVTLRAKLIDMATSHILATQLFEAIELAPSEDANGGVLAAIRATERLLREIRAFVLEYAPQATVRS
ncbi:MAG: ABC-type transport auxiliary lipoprotein family protein [Candidatus Competibacteraceae bacterium]|nr:ABC-type transport auxiliary lipoprotein family protein [Candidatus Competibacteraceae bacterium]